MPKELFAVVFDENNERTAKLLGDAYPKAYRLAPDVRLISEDTSAGVISETLQFHPVPKNESPAVGIVFQLTGAVQGYAPRDVWDWLKAVQD